MPSASTSTLSRPSASRSSLSHSMTVRSGIAAFSIGTRCDKGPREMTKPPVCCDRCRGKPSRVVTRCRQVPNHRAGRIQTGVPDSLRQRLAAVPPGDRLRQPVHLRQIQPESLADVAQRRARPVADHRRRQRRAVAAVFPIDVLDHLLAALMLEVDVDVGRLVALARNEALEQHLDARWIDFGDAEAIAHRRVGRRAASLAEDAVARARI